MFSVSMGLSTPMVVDNDYLHGVRMIEDASVEAGSGSSDTTPAVTDADLQYVYSSTALIMAPPPFIKTASAALMLVTQNSAQKSKNSCCFIVEVNNG